MLSRKSSTDMKHRRYRCRICGKEDGKGRLLGHVLKYHIPMDRVPFSCSLCNFRCCDRTTLVDHLTKYQRHVATKSGVTNLSAVLKKSTNPLDASSFIFAVGTGVPSLDEDVSDIDPSIFEGQDSDEPILPDWLSDLAMISEQRPAVPQVKSHQTSVLSVLQGSPFKQMATPIMSANCPARLGTGISSASKWIQQTVLGVPQTLNQSEAARSIIPIDVVATQPLVDTQIPAVLDGNTLNAPKVATPLSNTSSAGPVTVTRARQSVSSTPVLDELFLVTDIPLDQTYTADPLYLEGRRIEDNQKDVSASGVRLPDKVGVKTKSAEQQTDNNPCTTPKVQGTPTETPDTQAVGLADILRATESNGNKLHAVNRNIRAVQDEVHSLHRAILSLERTVARNQGMSNWRRSRTPYSGDERRKKRKETAPLKDSLKSTVKKVKKN